MNSNDILKRLHTDSENIQPTDKLNPEAIEASLIGVKRKTSKGVIATCSTIGVMCIVLLCVYGTGIFNSKQLTVETSPIQTNNSYRVKTNADNYSEIYKVVKSVKKAYSDTFVYSYGNNENKSYINEPAEDGSTSAGTGMDYSYTDRSDYSETNVQVEGVDEADVVKTDGTYIYSVRNKKVFITKADTGNPELISRIKLKGNIQELFIKDKKLTIITREYIKKNYESTPDEASDVLYSYDCFAYPTDKTTVTKVYIYDVSDPEKPINISVLTQSGDYISSRRIDDTVYLTTHHIIMPYENFKKNDPFTYCPTYDNGSGMKCIDANSITIGEKVQDIEYLNVSSIDLNNADKFADICSVLGGGNNVYASHNNIYVASHYYNGDVNKESTEIIRFCIDGTEIENTGYTMLDGNILNQFSMDEYEGYFRIVTEYYDNKQRETVTLVSVFDENLKSVGELKNAVGNENIESVRFDGDIAYFVTFENTDPLFTVDLSDPTNPKTLSELKITGFSEYLHPFGDGLLLGFGREADPETGDDKGLKISMFDISDKTNVKEIAKTVFTKGESYTRKKDYLTYSAAESDHKAIYIDVESKTIGIPYGEYIDEYLSDWDWETTENNYYIMFRYDEEKNEFIELKNILHKQIKNDAYYLEYTRGIKIGDYFYIVTPYEIQSYKYDTLSLYAAERMKFKK